jgi:hypothetical protein
LETEGYRFDSCSEPNSFWDLCGAQFGKWTSGRSRASGARPRRFESGLPDWFAGDRNRQAELTNVPVRWTLPELVRWPTLSPVVQRPRRLDHTQEMGVQFPPGLLNNSSVLLGEQAVSKAAAQCSNHCAAADADVARCEKGTDLVSRKMRVRTPPSALWTVLAVWPDFRTRLCESRGSGSNPDEDTCKTSEPDGQAAGCNPASSGFNSHRRL